MAYFRLAHGIHSLICQLNDMEPVKGDFGVGQVLPQAADVGFRHIDAGVPDLISLALMACKILRESFQSLGVTTGRCKDESALGQVMHQRDVVMATPTGGLIDPDGGHGAVVFTSLCLGDMVVQYPPKGPVISPQLPCRGRYRHGLGQRERKGFE